jgi:hypothetical protein
MISRWETSREGAELLLSYGIEYDHSMSHHDCQAYYLRTDDSWTKIDYSKKAKEWMKPLVKGQDTGLVEIPANWYLDDLPPHMFIKGAPNSHGFVNARDTEDLWRDHFDYFYREHDEFIFVRLLSRTAKYLLMKYHSQSLSTQTYLVDRIYC